MSLITLLVIVIVLVVVFWIFQTMVRPALPPPVANAILAIVGLLLIVWLLSAVGLLPDLGSVRIGK